MRWSFERAAAWLRPRIWLARVAGILLWVSWLAGFVLGQAVFTWESGPAVGPPTWDADPTGKPVAVDHLGFYSAAWMILHGQAASVYDASALREVQRTVIPPSTREVFLLFRNPPFYALLYVPTAWLPYAASAWSWNAISLVALAAGIWLLQPGRYLQAVQWALLFAPVYATVGFGQNSLLSLFVFCLSYRLLSGGRLFLAGLAAGLLWFKPPLLLGFIIWGLLDIRRLWPAACGVAVTGAVLVAASYSVVPEAWVGFVNGLRENAAYDDFEWWKMHNPRAFWRLLLPGLPGLSVLLWLITAGAGVWAFFRLWLRARDDLAAMFGASVLLMLWVSPHTMSYEWSMAVIPAVLWWRDREESRSTWLVLFAIGWVALFVGSPIGYLQEWVQKERFGVAAPAVVQLSVPVLAWAAWRASRQLAEPRLPRGAETIEP